MEPTKSSGVHLGLFKYGQGYWVRVMTAVLGALLILSGAGWAYREAGAVDIPVASWSISVKAMKGELAKGQTVTIMGEGSKGEEVQIGTGTVLSVQKTGDSTGTVSVSKLSYSPGQTSTVHKALKNEAFSGAVSSEIGNRVFEPLYLQAGIAGLIFLLGTIVIFYFVGRKPATVDFLIATDGEMRKVNWSTKHEIMTSTGVVVISTLLIVAFLFAVDAGFSKFFKLIGVLH
jgi:hypothetical protein